MQTNYYNERIRLRPFRSFDEAQEIVFALGLMDFGHWLPEYWSLQSLRGFYERDGMFGHPGPNFMALERQDGAAACGYMYLELPRVGQVACEIGTMLLPQHHGLGLGVDAKQLGMSLLFEHYPLQRVFAKTLASNTPALKSMLRCGMQYRGVWRGFMVRGGRRMDAHIYDILREQWQAQPWLGRVSRGANYA
ncbi:GNAT family N-acetyltransferase [bacterium]|nr:GNAT family N-acetyltransferase [bacterium]